MKKIIAFLLLTAFLLPVFSVSYDDNEFQRKSRAYTALANKSFDEGDYEAAIEYAKLAESYAQKSADFIQKMLAKTEAEQEMNKARTRLTWAKKNNVPDNYPEAYAAAEDAVKSGDTAFKNGSYDVAVVFAKKALKALSGVKAQAKKPAAPAKKPEQPKTVAQKPKTQEKPKTEPKKTAPAAKKTEPAVKKPAEPTEKKSAAQEEAAETKESEPAPVPPPEPAAPTEPADEEVTMPDLPAEYRVRTWRGEKDCFWNIAANDAVYGDPFMWRKLYEANKNKLPDPKNPDWVEPDTILVIPSIRGEKRSGLYDPSVLYKSLPDKAAKK